jgi:hypothetical protein
VRLGYDARRIEGPLQVAADNALQGLAAQPVAQFPGLPDALVCQVSGHLALQDAAHVFLRLSVPRYI